MIGRVPVLRENDMLELTRDMLNGRDHLVARGNGQRATGAEIALHVDDEKNIVLIDSHRNFLSGRT